jgi:pimeloyl-ACP methyl ester carboxylesterase
MLKLVLMPGMDGTGELFSEFVDSLHGSFKTVIVRYPTDQPLSYTELEATVLAACPVAESYLLIAESYSTPLAIHYAATDPANLVGMVLCAGFASSPVWGWRRVFGSLLAPVLFSFLLPDFALRFWLVGADAPNLLLAAVRRAISSVRPSVLASRLREVLGCDVRADLNRIAVPILYIQAKGDRLVDKRALDETRRIKPKVKVAVIDGPHLILQREPEIAAGIVVEFAKECIPNRII